MPNEDDPQGQNGLDITETPNNGADFGNVTPDAGTPAEDGTAPPEGEAKPDPMAMMMESIGKLGDAVSGIGDRIANLENNIKPSAGAIADDAGTPAPAEGEPGWTPKSWDDVPAKSREIAQEVYEENQRKIKEKEDQAKELDDKVNKILDDGLEALEKNGRLKPVTNADDPNDEGKQERAELLMYAVKLQTMNLEAVQDALDIAHQNGSFYNYKSQKFEKKDPASENRSVPVGSSSKISGGTNVSESDRMKTIKEARDLDDLVDKVGTIG